VVLEPAVGTLGLAVQVGVKGRLLALELDEHCEA